MGPVCIPVLFKRNELTFPLSYQGCQLTRVGSLRASIEYRVAVTGTTASVSPLPNKEQIRSNSNEQESKCPTA